METKDWKVININKIFDIDYGNKLDMCQMTPQIGGIPFITRTATNNGVGAYVELLESESPYPAHCLTIALGGSIGSTFLQNKPFYTSQNVAVLKPKVTLSDNVLLFLATIIEKECDKRFVAFGRELNKHIKKDFTIKLPLLEDDTPNWDKIESIINSTISSLPNRTQSVWENKFERSPLEEREIKLSDRTWEYFNLSDSRLFSILEKCKCSNATELLSIGNDIAYVGAKKSENGIMSYVEYNDELVTKGNCIVFIGDGQGSVGYTLYHPRDFIGSTTLIAGYNKKLNVYNAMFLVSVLDLERYRYSFGRKYNKGVISTSKIKLPVDINGNPDWQFMEDYIKSLPYSANL